jgi:hypothetical protein
VHRLTEINRPHLPVAAGPVWPHTTRYSRCAPGSPFHPFVPHPYDHGRVPSKADLRHVAKSLRAVAFVAAALPDDSPTDAMLRDRLELAADVLERPRKSLCSRWFWRHPAFVTR